MDKQLNARIKPDLHNQIKTLSTDSKIIMNTLVETLLEIGLKHYQSNSIAVDSNRYITQDDLKILEDRLKKLEMLFSKSATVQNKQVEQIELPSAIAIETTKTKPLGEITKVNQSGSYTREQLDAMKRDEVRTIYKQFVPSKERTVGSELHVDTILKPKMIDTILERQNSLVG